MARARTQIRKKRYTERLRDNVQLSIELAITDALTGAYNRRYFSEQLPAEIERCRRYRHALSVVMGDIDFFKKINDGYGHSAGDEVLAQFVQLTKRSIRATSDWIARYGGEEFIIVMPETGHTGAVQATEKLRAAIAAEPLVTGAGGVTVTASFGVATLLPEGEDAGRTVDQLIAVADARLYASKHAGRNRVTGA